jgi:polar amino acid transport system permease protein
MIELFKATALVSLISVADLMFEARQVNSITYMSAQAFGTALIIYYIIARFIITPVIRWLEFITMRKMGRG